MSGQPISIDQALDLAIARHERGDFADAESIYRQILAVAPDNDNALHLLGLLAYQMGRAAEAIDLINRAIAVNDIAALYHNNLGLALQNANRWADAERAFRSALILDSTMVEAHSNLGNLFRLRGNLVLAADSCRTALALSPNFAPAHLHFAQVLREENNLSEARHHLEQAIAFDPTMADAHNCLGLVHYQNGELGVAENLYRRAIALKPTFAEAYSNLARILLENGKLIESEDLARRAQTLKPASPEINLNLGTILLAQQRPSEAADYFNNTLKTQPDNVDALCLLGDAWLSSGETDRAKKIYRQVLAAHAKDEIRIRLALAAPVIARSVSEIEACRSHIENEIAALERTLIKIDDPYQQIGKANFFLTYHGKNNVALHKRIAAMYLHACPSLAWKAPHCDIQKPGTNPIRVGFISNFLYNHSIGKTTHGLIEKLARDRFKVFALPIEPVRNDEISQFIKDRADVTVPIAPNLAIARQQIAELELDILFYQDIGMDPFTYFLAFSRLAPVQCVSFGHPDTTGIPNMDYFVSNDLFESSEAATHYSEKLYLLHDLGTLAYYRRPRLPKVLKPREAFGLPTDANLYACPQTLFKFHPEFDKILGGILRTDVAGRLIVIESKISHWVSLLKERWQTSIADVLHRIIFIPTQQGSDFINLLHVCDVMLDTIHFNGMNTSLEAFSVGTPVVTMPTNLQRGRHTAGMYRKMGIDDCVARTAEEYVNIATRLGCHSDYRQQIKGKILERAPILYEDLSVVKEFERFFSDATENTRSTQR